MSSSFDEDQLQAGDTLDDRGVDDVLDEGMSPPERPSRAVARGITPAEDARGETLDDRLEQEEPDPALDHLDQESGEQSGEDSGAGTDPSDGFEVGDARTGRLAAPDDADNDVDAVDEGLAGGAASAEEAAVHTVEEDLP
jgi:hypothetical protein